MNGYLKKIYLVLLIFVLKVNVFSHPRFRDEFYFENKTRESIVVVFETIGLLSSNLRYTYDEENDIVFSFRGAMVAPDKHFRTIQPRKLYQIGFSQYNYVVFNQKTPIEKFSAFFKFILIFNDKGDLLYRIDDFAKFTIEDRTKTGPGVYVLVIE